MATSDKKLSQDASFTRNEYASTFKIKGKEFLPLNVINCVIKESIFDFLPTIDLTISDNGIFSEQYPIEDGDIIKLTLARSNQVSNVIAAEFIINDVKIDNNDGDKINSCTIQVSGFLKCKDMFHPLKIRSFPNQTSIDTLTNIGQECGFDIDARVKTADNMTWIQGSQNNYSMFYDVARRSFKQDDSVVCGVTRDSKMIITSLDTVQNSKTSIQAIYDIEKSISNTIDGGSPIYFNTYNFVNMMGTNNKRGAYKVQYGSYDFDEVVSNYVDSSKHKFTKYAFKNKNEAEDLTFNFNPLTLNNKNMHKNYYQAMANNVHYQMDFFKSYMLIQINPNKDVNLFDVIDLKLPSQQGINNINNPLSGKYMVGGSYYQVSQAGFFRQGLVLYRNGFNSSITMKQNEYKSVT